MLTNFIKSLDFYLKHGKLKWYAFGITMKRKRGEILCHKQSYVKTNRLTTRFAALKRSVTKAGTLQEARKREHYEKPSVKRKRKSEAARKRKKF